MGLTVTYDPTLGRIRLAADLLGATATYAVFKRAVDGGPFEVLRGGGHVTVSGQNASLDVYEFPPAVPVDYWVQSYNAANVQQAIFGVTFTQDVGEVWLKVIARPFLNQTIVCSVRLEVGRRARGGVFDVKGRSFPVAVSDVRGSREFELQVRTTTAAEARDFDLLLASGEPVYLQVPAENTLIPGGYYNIGDTNAEVTLPPGRLNERIFTLPVTEIAAPGPDVFGAAGTWQTVVDTYDTWTLTMAGEPTWADLLELIGTPGEVIVP